MRILCPDCGSFNSFGEAMENVQVIYEQNSSIDVILRPEGASWFDFPTCEELCWRCRYDIKLTVINRVLVPAFFIGVFLSLRCFHRINVKSFSNEHTGLHLVTCNGLSLQLATPAVVKSLLTFIVVEEYRSLTRIYSSRPMPVAKSTPAHEAFKNRYVGEETPNCIT